jgi:hypothetical protein
MFGWFKKKVVPLYKHVDTRQRRNYHDHARAASRYDDGSDLVNAAILASSFDTSPTDYQPSDSGSCSSSDSGSSYDSGSSCDSGGGGDGGD